MASATITDLRAATYKSRDSWWTVLLVDPVAVHLVRLADRVRWITPNRVTMAAFVVGLGAAACFATAQSAWLIIGAVLYHVAFVLDCVDGKLARWQQSGSIFGAWMDFIFDELRVLACTIALMGGQFLATGRAEFLLLGIVVVFLDMFRYLNGSHMNHVQAQMRARLGRAGAVGPAGDHVVVLDDVAGAPDGETAPKVDLHHSFRTRFSAAFRVRNWLQRHRIRPHPFSGIEFQMALFIVAPLTGAVLGVTVVACALTVLVELAFIYRFWLSTKDFRRLLQRTDAAPAADKLPGQRSPDPARPRRP